MSNKTYIRLIAFFFVLIITNHAHAYIAVGPGDTLQMQFRVGQSDIDLNYADNERQITQFCQLNYGTKFPQFKKSDVNGDNALPLYNWLKSELGFKGFNQEHPIGKILQEMLSKADPDFEKKSDIKWNFTKFLIDREGKAVRRFEPTDDLKEVEEEIKKLL